MRINYRIIISSNAIVVIYVLTMRILISNKTFLLFLWILVYTCTVILYTSDMILVAVDHIFLEQHSANPFIFSPISVHCKVATFFSLCFSIKKRSYANDFLLFSGKSFVVFAYALTMVTIFLSFWEFESFRLKSFFTFHGFPFSDCHFRC